MASYRNTGWASVTSSNLDAVRWLHDGSQSFLEVRFRSGSTYLYTGVPEAVYDALMAAPSKGVYFAANVKWAYSYQRV